jgi:hypothetical protein
MVNGKLPGGVLVVADGMIAATAMEHDLTLVTRNIKDRHTDLVRICPEVFSVWASLVRPGFWPFLAKVSIVMYL